MSTLDRENDLGALLHRAQALSKARKDREAYLLLCRAAASFPATIAVHSQIGNIHYRHKNFSRAEAAFRIAYVLAPDNAEQSFYLGRIVAIQGRDHEAIGYFENATRLRPQWSLAQFHLGACQLALGNLSAAIIALERASVLDPAMSDAHLLLGRAYVRADRMSVADRPLEFAVALSPGLSRKKAILMGTLTRSELHEMLRSTAMPQSELRRPV